MACWMMPRFTATQPMSCDTSQTLEKTVCASCSRPCSASATPSPLAAMRLPGCRDSSCFSWRTMSESVSARSGHTRCSASTDARSLLLASAASRLCTLASFRFTLATATYGSKLPAPVASSACLYLANAVAVSPSSSASAASRHSAAARASALRRAGAAKCSRGGAPACAPGSPAGTMRGTSVTGTASATSVHLTPLSVMSRTRCSHSFAPSTSPSSRRKRARRTAAST